MFHAHFYVILIYKIKQFIMRSVTQYYRNHSSSRHLSQLYLQVEQLQQMASRLQDCLPANLAEHVHIANYRQGILSLHVDASVWATRLRLVLPKIKRCPLYLRHKRLKIQQVNIKVRPQRHDRHRHTASAQALSADTLALLTKTAESVSYPPLQQALQRLALSSQRKYGFHEG